jgi:hypothetical protein
VAAFFNGSCFFQWQPLLSKAAAFASEAMWVSLKSSHFFSMAAALAAFDGCFFNSGFFSQQQPLCPLRQCGQFKSGHIASKVATFDGRFFQRQLLLPLRQCGLV